MKQVATKFGSLKIDTGGDALMSSDAKDYHVTYSEVTKMSSINIIIKTQHSNSTVINF